MTIIVIGAILFGLWKLGPRHFSNLGNDVLKLEWIRELQGRAKERASRTVPTAEELSMRFAARVTAGSVIVIAVCLWQLWTLGLAMAMCISVVISAGYAITCFRFTRRYRRVLLPLYLTLCQIPGSRWNAHHSARKWVSVPSTTGRPVRVRLPMDWHMGPMQQRMIQEIVTTRIPGNYTVEVDMGKFLMTFTPEIISVVNVENGLPISTTDTRPITVPSSNSVPIRQSAKWAPRFGVSGFADCARHRLAVGTPEPLHVNIGDMFRKESNTPTADDLYRQAGDPW